MRVLFMMTLPLRELIVTAGAEGAKCKAIAGFNVFAVGRRIAGEDGEISAVTPRTERTSARTTDFTPFFAGQRLAVAPNQRIMG
jgi:hypothetical protein